MMSPRDQVPEEQKTYGEILEAEIAQGLLELRRQAGGLILSGLSAGLDIGFSLLLMAVMLSAVGGQLPHGVVRILVANMYSVGFIFVVLGRSELFTEHTTLAVFPVLGGKASLISLARLWGLVFVANLAGTAISAALTVKIGPALGVIRLSAFEELARGLIDHGAWIIFLSALLAGWLMGLLSWLVSAGRDTISRIVIVWLVTTAIGFAQLHHSILGSVEVLAGVIALETITLGDYSYFLLWSTLGNAIGGVTFVALIKYSHAVRQ